MPTGYTAPIEDDPEYTFEQFVWRCARAFGALIYMRNDSLSAKATYAPAESSYYAEALPKARQRLEALSGMTLEQAAVVATSEHESALRRHVEREAQRAELRRRYQSMLQQATKWKPPTDKHRGLRDFMLGQLEESSQHLEPSAPPAERSADVWLSEQVAKARRDVVHYADKLALEKERRAEAIEWIEALRVSVPQPDNV